MKYNANEDIIIRIEIDEILSKIGQDVIDEIRRLINSGKNIDNEDLEPKSNDEIPTFYDTGTMLNSLLFIQTGPGFEIIISDDGRALISEYLKSHNSSWNILDNSDYIINFIDDRLQAYLDEMFND